MATPNRVNHQHKVEEAPSEASNKAQAQARRQRACGVKGQSPLRSKFLVRLRSQEMGRASIGVSLQAVQTDKEEHQIFFYHKAKIEAQNCTALLYPYTK